MRVGAISGRYCAGFIICRLFDRYFVLYGMAWVTVHFFRNTGHPLPFVNDWLTDLVFIPSVCHLPLTITRFGLLQNPHYCYPLSFVVGAAVCASIVFEVVLPRYSSQTVGDVFDCIAYFIGAIFFYQYHQKEKRVVSKAAAKKSTEIHQSSYRLAQHGKWPN
jgi:uncharacterized membrane protein